MQWVRTVDTTDCHGMLLPTSYNFFERDSTQRSQHCLIVHASAIIYYRTYKHFNRHKLSTAAYVRTCLRCMHARARVRAWQARYSTREFLRPFDVLLLDLLTIRCHPFHPPL